MNRHWFKFLRVAGVGLAAVLMSEQAISVPMNLIPNGDFEAVFEEDKWFESDYAYSPASNPVERQYTVTKQPHPWNPGFIFEPLFPGDHTSGSGNLFVGNGSSNVEDVVWSAMNIAVDANTDYFFEAWIMNLCCNENFTPSSIPPADYDPSKPISPASLSFFVNDVLLGLPLSTNKLGKWEPLSTMWNSGNFMSVDLKLVNSNAEPEGNDFGVDDIFFGTESTVVPEPGTLALLGLGLIGLGVARRRKAA